MDEIRWFAPNAYSALPVGPLRTSGLRIATAGADPARIAFAVGGSMVDEAFRFARRHRARLIVYLWDLPPWRLGDGLPAPVVSFAGRLVAIPRFRRGYPQRPGAV